MLPLYNHLGVWKHGGSIVVRFGEHRILDELTVKKIGDELYAVAARADCCTLILDFSSVTGLSSLMLGKLLMLHKTMAKKGGRLVLCDIGREIEDVLAETKLARILEIRETEKDALAEFRDGAVEDK